MTLRSGLAAQIGAAEETTWGVPVAPTRFWPLLSEDLTADPEPLISEAIIVGRRLPSTAQRHVGRVRAGGDVGFELYDRSVGLLFKHMFGTVATTGSGPYTHTFTPGDLPVGLTVQVGLPDVDNGTVNPFTFAGSKVESWEIAAAEGEIATLGLTLASRHAILHRTVTDGVTTSGSASVTSATAVFSEDDVNKPISGTGIPANTTILSVQSATAATLSANATATATGVTFTLGVALASASYASGLTPFTWVGTTLTIAGSSYAASSITISGNNSLNTDRGRLGQRGRAEPLEAGLREITGTVESEFFNMDMYRRFVRGDDVALVAAFTAGSNTLTITMNVEFEGTTPTADGPDIIGQSLPFRVLGTTTDASAITAVMVNGDSTP